MRSLRNAAGVVASSVPNVPDVELYAIDVSFAALADEAERTFLNDLPTSFVLSPDAVDRLRAAAARLVRDSPELQRFLRDVREDRGAAH